MARLIKDVSEIRSEVQRIKARQNAGAAAILGFGFAGYNLLNPG
jgi:hypothetical protein